MSIKTCPLTGQDIIIKMIYSFYKSDSAQLFSFSSGHLGALPFSDRQLLSLFEINGFSQVLQLSRLIIIELVKFLILTIFPFKNLLLILRTTLRKTLGKRPDTIYKLSVMSLGNHIFEKDPYFGVLLRSLDEKFNYLKIVGGFNFKSSGYIFVESGLSYLSLGKVIFSILLSPFFSIIYLIGCARKLDRLLDRAIFIILSLKEINSGSFNGNKVITKSIEAWLEDTKINKFLYPMEGRNWEKNIVKGMSKSKVKSIGYLHCALTPRHFSLNQTGFYQEESIPDIIIAPSEMCAKILNSTFPKVTVRNGFFLRGSRGSGGNEGIKHGTDTLLFALTGNIEESGQILSHLFESKVQECYKIVIRLNPNTSSYMYLQELVERYKFILYREQKDYLPSVCFFRSSSVALDYLRLGVLPVYINLGEIVSNNVFELDNKYQFESVDFSKDKEMSIDLSQNIKKIVDIKSKSVLNGAEMSDYYLNQSYNSRMLVQLLN
jgi:hypothetical protein